MPSLPRALLLAVGGTTVAGVALVGVATAASGSSVPRGVRVAGVDLGGDSRAEAAGHVRGALAGLITGDVAVQAGDVRGSLAPAASGLGVDVDAMVDDAASGGPLDRVRGLFGASRTVTLRPRVDEATLRRSMQAFKATVDRAPREGSVRYEQAVPVAVLPAAGRALDLEAAVRTVRERWPDGPAPLVLPTTTTPVTTTAVGVQSVLRTVGQPAVAAPVRVDVGGRALEVRPADIAAALTFPVGADGVLRPVLSGPGLRKALGGRATALEQPAVPARIRLRGGRPEIVPSQTGLRLDPAGLAAAVLPVLGAPAPRTARLSPVQSPPSLTTEQARRLGVKDVIGTFTTRFPCCRPRVTNIRRIASIVDDTLVLPGDTFSLNGAVGRRTAAKGFVAAPQILRGEFVDDVGGGVSQFATTMYNAAFFGGLQDVTHKPHSYYISRYPPGREATVFYPSVDLRWRNDSGRGVLVTTSTTGTSVTVTLYGTKRFDVQALTGPRTRPRPFVRTYVQREDCTAASGAEGFDITVTRVLRQGGREVRREPRTTRYLPEPNFVCGPPPA